MSRPWLRVHLIPVNDTAMVNGPGSGDLIRQAGGRTYWSRGHRAYMTSVKVAERVLALADDDGREVRYSEQTSEAAS